MKIALITDTHYRNEQEVREIHEKFAKDLNKACVDEKVSLLVHCGDWISHNQYLFPLVFDIYRSALGDLPILGVKGNHDFWDSKFWKAKPSHRKWTKHPAGMNYHEMRDQHREWADKYDIQFLENMPYRHDENGPEDTVFYGFDGWYANLNPPTNDGDYMFRFIESAPMHVFLSHKSGKDLDWIFEDMEYLEKYPNVKKACVTHFSFGHHTGDLSMCANPRYLDHIAMHFDVLLYGHSHLSDDSVHEYVHGNTVHNCRMINSGGDYNDPVFKIIEI